MGDEKSKKRRSSPTPSPEERRKHRKKRHGREEEEEEETKTRRRREKENKREKSSKHGRTSEEDKEKKPKDKHKHRKKDTVSDFKQLSEEDYFSKNNEFATWLKEEKSIFFSDLSSESAHDLFSGFIKKWNSGKLEQRYYEGISSGPRSAHKWKIKA
ncbi:hypothetical protein FCM35_KLT13638 [Carex littledalei]|uniref:Style cell-cycle inhibitor 1-A n=1 Tax=Carex littledalei TaxID=544730 RepID=A0A833V3M9_9POAL|nr:hypothetical protein FCM35_KLT13638 [Carex littledalei]